MSEWHEGPCCGACFGDEEAGTGMIYSGYCCCYDERAYEPYRSSGGFRPVATLPPPEVTYGTYVSPPVFLPISEPEPPPVLSATWQKIITERAGDQLEQ